MLSTLAGASSQTRFGFSSYSFLSESREDLGTNTSLGFLTAEFYTDRFLTPKLEEQAQSEMPSFQARMVGYYSRSSTAFSNLNVRDLYFQSQGIAIGRKTQRWSFSDEQWQLGMFEPQYRSRTFLPESQGLTGVFLDLPIILPGGGPTKMGFQLFASPLFFPDQGPGFMLENGRFQAQNPWFNLPPTEALFAGTGVTDEIRYNIVLPSVDKIVFNSSFGGSFILGNPELDRHYLQLSSFSKPSSHLNIQAKARSTANESIQVDLYPGIQRQRVGSADYRFRPSEQMAFNVGLLSEESESLVTNQSDLTWSYVDSRQLYNLGVTLKTNTSQMHFGYLAPVTNSELKVGGPQATQLSRILGAQQWLPSPQYQVRLEQNFRVRASRYFSHQVTYRRSVGDQFEYIGLGASVDLEKNWKVLVGAELMKSSTLDNFYTRYDDLDWLQLGAQYVF